MKFSFIPKYFVPREKKFFSLFNHAATNLAEGSEQLKKLFYTDSIKDRKAIVLIIRSIERKGDEYTNGILTELNSTYVSSLDGEFVQELGFAIDDILYLIYGLSEKIDLYPVANISDYMKEMVSLINESCRQLQLAVEGLENPNDADNAIKSCKELDKILIQLDNIRRAAIASLFENEKDPVDLIKHKEIVQNIETAAKKIENISRIIKATLLKYA